MGRKDKFGVGKMRPAIAPRTEPDGTDFTLVEISRN